MKVASKNTEHTNDRSLSAHVGRPRRKVRPLSFGGRGNRFTVSGSGARVPSGRVFLPSSLRVREA